MDYDEFKEMCMNAYQELRFMAPNRETRYKPNGSTGNLAFNAVKKRFYRGRNFKTWIDEDIAPYAPYTNEPWLSPHWKGKKNPNEGWFERTARRIAENTAKYCGGTITKWSKRK